jgi:hypothetical protein
MEMDVKEIGWYRVDFILVAQATEMYFLLRK